MIILGCTCRVFPASYEISDLSLFLQEVIEICFVLSSEFGGFGCVALIELEEPDFAIWY